MNTDSKMTMTIQQTYSQLDHVAEDVTRKRQKDAWLED